MGSQTLEILRQGVWASLTGGWFFDPHQEIFTNTFHFYLWIILLCLPFSLYLGAPPSNLVWALYAAFVGILFAIIKFLNYRLHLMFDGEEFHSEDDQREDSTSNRGISRAESVRDSVRQPSVTVRREDSGLSHIQGGEVIEMEVINQSASADCNGGHEPDPNISQHALSTSLASSLLNQLQPLENNTEQDSGDHSNKITEDLEEKRKPTRIKEISFALEAPTSDDSDDSSSQSPSGKMKSQATNTTGMTEKNTPEKHDHSQFESMTSFKSEQSQEPGQTYSDQLLNSESKGELSDALSSLSSYPIPNMESAIFEARSAPGLAVAGIWEPNVSSPKSEGSAISISGNPCTTLEAVAAALENFDHTRKAKISEASPEFKDEDGQTSTSRMDSFSKEITDQDTASVLRQESQREFGQHRPRSISDIVRESKQENKETSGSGAESGRDSPAQLDASSLHDSCKLHNPSMSSQPESLDSTSVCIAMNNKDTASTATQTGSLCEAEGSGREGSDLILARRSSQLARRRRRLQRHSVRRRRRTDSGPGTGPLAEVLLQAMDTAPQSAHVAASYNDTTPGALHCYQDEFGQWQTYIFEGDGPISTSIVPVSRSSSRRERGSNWETSSSSSTFGVEHSMEAYDDMPPVDLQRAISQRRWHDTLSSSSIPVARPSSVTPVEKFSVPHYFKFQIIPNKFIKIKFDRLSLLALMDRNKSIFEALASVVLAVLVAVLGYWLLVKDFFKDFWIFLFCFIIASCQFSLLKSVQPDAASPTHGHNHIVVFSRPVYFVCLATIVLILDRVMQSTVYCLTLYSLPLCTNSILIYTRDFLIGFILGFPLLFLIGLLPQVNTFAMYLLEQIDMHVFGGNAMTSLRGSVVSVLRSIFATAVLYGFCYGAMSNETMGSQHVLFSIFSGLLVAISYHLSRTATDPTVLVSLLRSSCLEKNSFRPEADFVDPLPEKLKRTVTKRLQNDLVCSIFILIFVFAIHVSTVFTTLQPYVGYAMYGLAGAVGIVNHYIWPQLRKPLPWLCFAVPFFKSREFNQFEVRDAAKIMRFEKAQVWLNFIERNFVYPAVFLSALTEHSKALVDKFGILVAPIIICVIGLKLLRSAFSDSSRQHMILIFTLLFFKFDFGHSSETLLVDYFFMSIFMSKFYELILKVRFIVTYIAPWQITWGSAFHAFAQPFSVPHSAMLFFQAIVSSIFSAPLNPVLGSAIFITSYVRPVKFWEKDYNTNRVDHSNTRLSSQLDRNPGSDDNNLNSIFYEHLTRSLQHSLCGDLMLGRWGPVSTGDCFVLASDYLNALVHIIEVGNGLVTFQLRGLEFRGTYCQQREVEAITEGVEDDNGCCCCEPGHLPNMLSLNAAFGQRWLAWEVTSTKYIIEGYSISDNSAASMLQVFDLRKILVTYYVKSVIFYAMRSTKLDQWLANETLIEAIAAMHDPSYVDLDSCFYSNIDEDYDLRQGGISRSSYLMCYLEWIQYCGSRRQPPLEADRDSTVVTLCFALCLLARRALGTASHQQSASLESFLYGLHALFKGDFRITSLKDEWVFADVDFLRKVVAPGVRMSLKLHQDHFSSMDDYDDHAAMYEAITNHEHNMVISHEGDPAWRQAVLANTPSLLALRHVFDDGADEYKIIMLNKRYLSFRVIKVNRECVRGLWAGQLQELIFLRNRNPERGSIQNAKQALRNIINSSCDQPIGYPIYVSPLTTSYVDTNAQLSSVIGGPMSFNGIRRLAGRLINRFRARCGASCHSGGDPTEDAIPEVSTTSVVYTERFSSFREGSRSSALRTSSGRLPRTAFNTAPVGFRSSTRSGGSQISGSKRPSAAVNVTQPSSQSQSQSTTNVPTEGLNQMIRIIDIGQVYDTINLGRRIDVQWPSEYMRERGGKNYWKDWRPAEGMEGVVVHKWQPCHRDITQRSHVDRTILLVKIDDKFVPIADAGVTEIGYEV